LLNKEGATANQGSLPLTVAPHNQSDRLC